MLRILPVGGVVLAILILILALTPPGGVRRALAPTVMVARGPLINRDEHPEWRQFLIRAALRRADALDRLRELPDTPVRLGAMVPAQSEPVGSNAPSQESAPVPDSQAVKTEDAPKIVADLPTEHAHADPRPDDITGTINELPGATIPVDIGETSSTELPVVLPEERPPIIRTPEHVKPRESRRKLLRRTHHAKAQPNVQANPQVFGAVNFFEILFRSFSPQRPAYGPVIKRAATGRRSSIKRITKVAAKHSVPVRVSKPVGVSKPAGVSKVAQETPLPTPQTSLLLPQTPPLPAPQIPLPTPQMPLSTPQTVASVPPPVSVNDETPQ